VPPPKRPWWRRLLWTVLTIVVPCLLAVLIFRGVMQFWAWQAISAADATAEQDLPGWRQAHVSRPGITEDAKAADFEKQLAALHQALPQGWPWNSAVAAPQADASGTTSFVLRKGASVVDKLYYNPPLLPYESQQLVPPRTEYLALDKVYPRLPEVPDGVVLAFPVDWSSYREGRLQPTTAALFQLGQLHLLRVFLRIEEGSGQEIAGDLTQLVRIVHLMRGDPTVRGNMARQSVLHGTLLMAERWVARRAPGVSELTVLQAAFAWPELVNPDLAGLLRSERALRFEQLDKNLDVQRGRADADDSVVGRWFTVGDDLQQARTKYLPLVNRAVQIAAAPRREWGGQWTAWNKDLQKLATSTSPEFQSIYSWLTNVQSVCLQEAILQTRCEAMCVGLAAERFRLQQGHWPAKAEELVPAFLDRVPPDPFVDAPLRFARLGDGITVYSVGTDRKDHSGHLNRQLAEVEQTDLGVQLWAPNARRLVPGIASTAQ